MDRSFKLIPFLVGLFLFFVCSAEAQNSYCATQPDPPTPVVVSQVGGVSMTAFGGVNALMLFIDYYDDNSNQHDPRWPLPVQPATQGIGPSYLTDIIDLTSTQSSGTKYNVTTYFKDMSRGNLTIYGHPIYRRAPKPLANYQSSTKLDGTPEPENQSTGVPYYTIRDVLQLLDPGMDFGPFDKWTRVYDQQAQKWVHVEVPDGEIDLFIVCFRDRYSAASGFIAEGWQGSPFGTAISIDNGTRTISQGHTIICQNMRDYPASLHIPFHEIGHLLIGGDYFHQYSGGMWSFMGAASTHTSYFMNAWERERLGWITYTDITADNATAVIPDFGTTGTAYRYLVPGGFGRAIIIENHQLLNSPYITSSPDTYTYDLVNRNNGGAPGLYVLKVTPSLSTSIQEVVCADGRWVWDYDGDVLAPWSAYIPVFKRGVINRETGRTDRVLQPFPLSGGGTGNDYILAWRDELTGELVNNNQSRSKGDGKDRWALNEAEMFSPWSNPSTECFPGYTANFGMEVIGQSGTDISVKFFTSSISALAAEPSKPQGFNVGLQLVSPSQTESYNPKLTWIANIESDVHDIGDPPNSPGHYEIWRKTGAGGTWSQIATVIGSATSYVDASKTLVPGGGGSEYYKIRAVDAQSKVSVFTPEDVVAGPSLPYKIAPAVDLTSAEKGAAIRTVSPNPAHDAITIQYELRSSEELSLELIDPMGRIVDSMNLGTGSAGVWEVEYNVSGLSSGVYYVVLKYGSQSAAKQILVRQ